MGHFRALEILLANTTSGVWKELKISIDELYNSFLSCSLSHGAILVIFHMPLSACCSRARCVRSADRGGHWESHPGNRQGKARSIDQIERAKIQKTALIWIEIVGFNIHRSFPCVEGASN
jgi:hypothetical protein